MDKNMKRKQFHLTIAEEKIIYEAARRNNVSEAEIVRIAIQEYGARHMKQENSLISMAIAARSDKVISYPDLSLNHDKYLEGDNNDG